MTLRNIFSKRKPVPEFEQDAISYGFAKSLVVVNNLPFVPEPDEAIYLENEHDDATNAFIVANIDLITRCFARENLRFVYLPALTAGVDWAAMWRYHSPGVALQEQLPKVDDSLPSNFLLNYMTYPQNRHDVSLPAIVRVNPIKASELELGGSYVYDRFEIDITRAESDTQNYLAQLATCVSQTVIDVYEYLTRWESKGCCLRCDMRPRYRRAPESADEKFDRETKKLLDDARYNINLLRRRGISDVVLSKLLFPQPELSPLRITADYRIFLTAYDNQEVVMTPLVKAVFFLFLRHPEGIAFKQLADYGDEIALLYSRLKGEKQSFVKRRLPTMRRDKSVMALTNPLDNSINEKCARIREAFLLKIDEKIAKNYFVTGERGEPKGIALPRNLVEWEMPIE
ncbi:MAG: hypothetical protein IK092_07530 [Muribaculaceae bacterium]|nr:hypothetical protein [Muribaculaceae bacterium]